MPTDRRPILALALLIVTALLCWAGLRPFDFADLNNTSWITPGPGLAFQDRGVAFTTTDIEWNTLSAPASMTIEMWIETRPVADFEPRTWLVLQDNSNLTPFGFRQRGSELIVWDAVTNPPGDRWYNDRRVAGAMRPGVMQHIALTSGAAATQVYVDGSAVEFTDGFGIPFARQAEPFAGRLVIGSGPPWTNSWYGSFYGLALYDSVLSAETIRAHAELDRSAIAAALAGAVGLLASYTFADQPGHQIRDSSGQATDLYLPKYYHPPGRQLLALSQLADWSTSWNILDVALNLAGFVLFGLLLAAYLDGLSSGLGQSSLLLLILVTAVGFGLSLSFELTQVYMASRSSSLQDLLLNTAGSLTGAGFYLLSFRLVGRAARS